MYNATRRNRNIGTAKAGYKNQSVFKEAPSPMRDFLDPDREFLKCEKVVENVHGQPVTFFTDTLREGYIHSCSIQDVVSVLSRLPADDVAGIGCIRFRQQTRKTETFSLDWGRLRYFGGPDFCPIIELDSHPCPLVLNMPNSLLPFWQIELDVLKTECKEYKPGKRHHTLTFDAAALRKVQLFRTLPHEVGHWVDYKSGLSELPCRQKEERANSYARLANLSD